MAFHKQHRAPKAQDSVRDELIFGIHPVLEALAAGRPVDKILLRKGIDPEIRRQVTEAATQAGIPMQTVPAEKLDFMLRGKNHQGLAAFVSLISYANLENVVQACFDKGKEPLILLLDGITDVRNFGAIARSAECLGADGIVIPEQGSVRVNGEAIRISSGALLHLPVVRTRHTADAVYLLQASGLKVVACHEKAKQTVFEADLKGPLCLVMGSESEGIPEKIIKACDGSVSIPMKGKVSSLNVSVAAGILLALAGQGR